MGLLFLVSLCQPQTLGNLKQADPFLAGCLHFRVPGATPHPVSRRGLLAVLSLRLLETERKGGNTLKPNHGVQSCCFVFLFFLIQRHLTRSFRFDRLEYVGTRCLSFCSILVGEPSQKKEGKRALLGDQVEEPSLPKFVHGLALTSESKPAVLWAEERIFALHLCRFRNLEHFVWLPKSAQAT